ncbi:MAG: hypothetical protein IT284_01865 [Bacteroidetes bacterium]|nr:hypothetical protein [Bacteroidota bacterium]
MTQELSNEARWAIESSDRMRKLRRSYWGIKFLQIFGALILAVMATWAGYDYGAGKVNGDQFWLIMTVGFPAMMWTTVFMLSFKLERLRLQLKDLGEPMNNW